jgi:hypothetical protein
MRIAADRISNKTNSLQQFILNIGNLALSSVNHFLKMKCHSVWRRRLEGGNYLQKP